MGIKQGRSIMAESGFSSSHCIDAFGHGQRVRLSRGYVINVNVLLAVNVYSPGKAFAVRRELP